MFGFVFFCEQCHKEGFWPFLAAGTWLKPQPLDQSIWLKFSLETRLESESFETLIDFLAFVVQKLWPKLNKK